MTHWDLFYVADRQTWVYSSVLNSFVECMCTHIHMCVQVCMMHVVTRG